MNNVIYINDYAKKKKLSSVVRHKRILIVEDDEVTASAIKYLIEHYSPTYICHIAKDSYEALNELSQKKFDFVMVDENIPGLNGSETITRMDRFIAQDPLMTESGAYDSKVPVVFMSSNKKFLTTKEFTRSIDHLDNFSIHQVIEKSQLPYFLSTTFAN